MADPTTKVPLLQFARVQANESRLRQHAAQLAAVVPGLASHCVVRRGAEVSFCKDRVILDCAAAERFICEWSTRLRGIEHKIVIPATLNVEYLKRVIVIRRRPIDFNSSSGLFTAEKLLKFRWDVVLNGEPIDVAELEALAEQKRALLLWRGKWIFFEPEKYPPEKLAEIAERIRQQPVESLSRLETLRAVFERDTEWNGIPLEIDDGAVSGADWLSKLCERSPLVDIGKPSGLKPDVELRHYQQSGLNWLSFMSANGFGALLADDMGLGKTLQTLAWLQHRKNSGSQKPCLLVCPTSVMDNWKLRSLLRHSGCRGITA